MKCVCVYNIKIKVNLHGLIWCPIAWRSCCRRHRRCPPSPPPPPPPPPSGLSWTSEARVKVGAVPADHQSAKLANLQPTLLHPTMSTLQLHLPPPSHHRHSLSLSLTLTLSLCLSPALSFSLGGCEDASSTLQWRQIRPSRPCHRKTSPRKVATSSPFQLICRHGKSEEEEGPPCSGITTSSILSQERNREIIGMEREFVKMH